MTRVRAHGARVRRLRWRTRLSAAVCALCVGLTMSLSPDGLAPAAPAAAQGRVHFPPPTLLAGLPRGPRIAALTDRRCRAVLRRHRVPFRRYDGPHDDAIRGGGILLTGPVNGVTFQHSGRRDVHSAMDCRLAVSLLAWTETLRHYAVTRVVHLSTFRHGARVASSGRPSGHAKALAFDLRFVHFEDGTRIDVLEDWTERTRGAEPCAEPEGEPGPSRVLRRLTCAAGAQDLFQVIITPHHNDAHANHVHLELRPDVTWRFFR